MTYELLKNHKTYGWCLEFIFHNEENALAELAKRQVNDPEGEYKIQENENPWYNDPTNF